MRKLQGCLDEVLHYKSVQLGFLLTKCTKAYTRRGTSNLLRRSSEQKSQTSNSKGQSTFCAPCRHISGVNIFINFVNRKLMPHLKFKHFQVLREKMAGFNCYRNEIALMWRHVCMCIFCLGEDSRESTRVNKILPAKFLPSDLILFSRKNVQIEQSNIYHQKIKEQSFHLPRETQPHF